MLIFKSEYIDCPLCDGKIIVIVENDRITSHGICHECDHTFSAERLQFTETCKRMEEEFMYLSPPKMPADYYLYEEELYVLPCHPELGIHTCRDELFCELDYELREFYALLD